MNESVTLAIMAKAPAPIVERAILSVAKMVDRALLVVAPGDPLARTVWSPIPLRIVEQPWLGYGETRTRMLEIAGEDPRTDWVFMLDAYVEARGALPPPGIRSLHDSFDVAVFEPKSQWRWFRHGHLMRARRGFSWPGGLHEAQAHPPGARLGTWPGLTIVGGASPKRDGNGRTYAADAAALEALMTREPSARTAFYLAQSLKDAGNACLAAAPEEAKAFYRRAFDAFTVRANLGGNPEEVFWSLMWRARIAPLVDESPVPHLLAASRAFPERAEPLNDLSWHHRRRGEHDAAQRWGQAAWSLPYPTRAKSFVECGAYSPDALEAAGVVMWPAPREPDLRERLG